MVIKHLLTGMILQVGGWNTNPTIPWEANVYLGSNTNTSRTAIICSGFGISMNKHGDPRLLDGRAGFIPIGFMGLVYLPTFGCFFLVNVGTYTSPMDPMGFKSRCSLQRIDALNKSLNSKKLPAHSDIIFANSVCLGTNHGDDPGMMDTRYAV